MRVLLFSNDLMPFGDLPTSGGGLRCYQLLKGLESHGIEVISSMPGFTYLAQQHYQAIPEEQRSWLWQWHTQDELLKRAKPDAVIFASNWDHYNLSKIPEVPLIIDLHGSRLIETSMWGAPIDTDQKVKILSKADCLLCAGRRQRSYFYGWLLQAGRVPEDEHFIRYIPISLSPEIPEKISPAETDFNAPYFVSGGGWFPWQNQSRAVFAICREISLRSRSAHERHGTIDIYGTPHETAQISPEEQLIRDVYKQIKSLSADCPQVRVGGYVGRKELIEIYRRSSVAVELMQYNLERELAFTTRTVEYLWCGLPVIYNNYAELSEHIADFDAGWTLDPQSDSDIANCLDEIFSQPELLKQKGLNAQALVRERFSWDKTIQPLLDFLERPSKARLAKPVLSLASPKAPYLNPERNLLNRLSTQSFAEMGKSLRQDFIIPADDVVGLNLNLEFKTNTLSPGPKLIELEVRNSEGVPLQRRVFDLNQEQGSQLRLLFPRLGSPAPGSRLSLYVRSRKITSALREQVLLKVLPEAVFPLIADGDNGPVLSLSFLAANRRLDHYKRLARRALGMAKSGEWQRLGRAAMRRLPAVYQKLSARVRS